MLMLLDAPKNLVNGTSLWSLENHKETAIHSLVGRYLYKLSTGISGVVKSSPFRRRGYVTTAHESDNLWYK